MWAYLIRRLAWNIPVYLGILLFIMLVLRVRDPVFARLPKNATEEDKEDIGVEVMLTAEDAAAGFRLPMPLLQM